MSEALDSGGDVAGLLVRLAQLKEKAREGGQGGTSSSPSKRPDWTASGSTAFCRAKRIESRTLSIPPSILTSAAASAERRPTWIDQELLVRTLLTPQTRRAAGVRDGQGADIRRGRPPPDLSGSGRKTLVGERVEHVSRIKGLLFAKGVSDYEPLKRNRRARLEGRRRAMAAPCRRT